MMNMLGNETEISEKEIKRLKLEIRRRIIWEDLIKIKAGIKVKKKLLKLKDKIEKWFILKKRWRNIGFSSRSLVFTNQLTSKIPREQLQF
jgi:hypothetical protein